MRALLPAFSDHMATGTTTLCYCWRVMRNDDVVLGFTDHDRMLNFIDTDFIPNSGFDGSRMSSSADLAVDNSDVEGLLSHESLTERDIVAGLYDNARIESWRVNWTNTAERVLLKTGILGEITRGTHGFSAEVRGLSHVLDQTVGRLYQRQCDASVGDKRCAVDLDNPSFSGAGEVIEIIDDNRIIATGLDAFTEGWFVEGVLTWSLDGNVANRATSGFVKAFSVSASQPQPRQTITLWQPMRFTPRIGDQFTVSVGCDRRFETCRDKFSNAINFRGFHLMPGNDFIISYPLRSDANDGGKR